MSEIRGVVMAYSEHSYRHVRKRPRDDYEGQCSVKTELSSCVCV